MKDSEPTLAYRSLAQFHHEIRRFLHLEEEVARANGLEPRQYQVMVAIKGLPGDTKPNIQALALRLYLKHHTVVGLVNRLERKGLAVRRSNSEDRREVFVELTRAGEKMFKKLEDFHLQRLETISPEVYQTLREASGVSPDQSNAASRKLIVVPASKPQSTL